jgi:hypothetical protein
MQRLHKLSLTDEDINIIRKRRNAPFWMLGIMTAVFDLFLIFMVKDDLTLILIVVGAFDLMMLIPILILYKRWQKDIEAGYKFAMSGPILRKNATSGKSRVTYITIGTEKFVVTEAEYKDINEGDEIEVHFTAHTRTSLFLKKL